ncbi:hypothetical protein DFH29DRAFT_1007306 [Suillus ampliporus]|nr:hypothetical protein DFH29DRAFT_1007306 [Suillus ampliporus]
MAPRKAPAGQNASQGVANQAVVVGIQKDASKRRLDEGTGDTYRDLETSSAAHPTNQQAVAVAHLVPPGSIPPHPPQSFDHMLPHHQRYDAYMRPASTDPDPKPLEMKDTPSESNNIPIDPAIREQESTIRSMELPRDHSTDIERIPPPPAKFNQSTRCAPANITKKSLTTSAPSNNPFDVFSTGSRLESASPTSTVSSLTLSAALTTPSRSTSVAPQLSAGNRHVSVTPTESITSTRAAVVIPKWLTDTIRCLENDVKSHKEKLEETEDLLQEQTEELNELRQLIATLRDDQTQLGEDVDKTRVSLDSVCSNIDVITKSLQGSGEPSKVKVAHAAGENAKDNIWNTGVRKTFLKAIGVMKASMIKEYHPHKDGSQIKGEQKLEERISSRTKSNLTSMEWDFAFTFPYQSTDESVQSEDDHGGIDPDTDEEKDLRKKPAKVKVPSILNQAMDHLNDIVLETKKENKKTGRRHPRTIGEPRDRNLPDVKTGLKIPIGLIDSGWLQVHPQDPSRYDGTIVMTPDSDDEGDTAEPHDWHDDDLADDEQEGLPIDDEFD